jgi:triosephosphate isomerase
VAEYVILGHSERTHIFKEDPELIAHKVSSAFAHDLTPILCIGEDNEGDSKKQLVHLLKHLIGDLSPEQLKKLVLAYEPVWAIGTGKAATPEYAQGVMESFRAELTPQTRILYGGSANDENAEGFLALPDCDGLLVGGASLKQTIFLTMCQIANDLAGKAGHPSLHVTEIHE